MSEDGRKAVDWCNRIKLDLIIELVSKQHNNGKRTVGNHLMGKK